MLVRLGRGVARRAPWVAAGWLVAAVLAYLAAVVGVGPVGPLFSRLVSGELQLPSESQTGRDLLTERAAYGPSLQLVLDDVDPTSPAVLTTLAWTREDLARVPGVARVLDPQVAPDQGFVATDGRAVLVSVDLVWGLDGEADQAAAEAVTDRLTRTVADVPGAGGGVTGVAPLVDEITGQVERDLRTGEAVALPVSLFVMILIFGGFAAASVPLLGALASIAGGLAALLGFAYVLELDASVVNVTTVIGLGLCIDYGLLIVSRYREELGRLPGRRPGTRPSRAEQADALGATLGSAGRTVAFSAVTVAISVASMVLFEIDLLRATGLAACAVVLVALLVALTLVPALVVLLGRWLAGPGALARVPVVNQVVRRLGDIPPADGVFSRLAARVQRRPMPLVVVVVVAAALLALAAPVLRLELRNSSAELLPPGNAQRELFLDVEQRFPATTVAPIQVVLRTDQGRAAGYAARAAGLSEVGEVRPPEAIGDLFVVDVFPAADDPQGSTARQVVRDLRAAGPGVPAYVTGQTAQLVDFQDGIADRAPWALALVVAATVVLLFLMTGSVLIPIKALLMNLLSLGAAFGMLGWVFQDGHLEGPLGFAAVGGIEATVPIIVLAFAFGLSMDYEVFLLSRIKERHDAGADNDTAVREGLQRTGRIITSAALIICIVFAGFAAGQLLIIKQTGLALAFAVAVDATLVRCLLVPATMTLLGEWNWWAPAPLRRLHRGLGLART